MRLRAKQFTFLPLMMVLFSSGATRAGDDPQSPMFADKNKPQFKNVRIATDGASEAVANGSALPTTSVKGKQEPAALPWKVHSGKAGPSQWRCNVIQPDPKNHGPDGINIHDWDGDGDLDIFSNAEEGRYSRLYFNPGAGKVREVWSDYVEFPHGKCEDSGMGDLDNAWLGDLDGDGDLDVATTEENGGWGVIWFENPANN